MDKTPVSILTNIESMCPTFSIIIAHYDIPDLLMRCLKSIPISEDIQVIVVDDNSPDADTYIERYPELSRPYLEFVRAPKNGGAGYARNIGLDHAKGKWLLFADADDFFSDRMYSQIYAHADSEADMIFFRRQIIPSNSDICVGERGAYIDRAIDTYLRTGDEQPIRTRFDVPYAKMVRRELVLKKNIRFDEVKYSNDCYFSACVGCFARSIEVVDVVIYMKTIGDGQLTRDFAQKEGELQIRADVSLRVDKFLLQQGMCRHKSIKRWLLRMVKYDRSLFANYFNHRLQEVYPSRWAVIKDLCLGRSVKFRIWFIPYSLMLWLSGIARKVLTKIKKIFEKRTDSFLLDHCPKVIISRKWKREMGYSLDWKHPRDINEKIQWLLVYGDTTEWTRLADKYKVREYVKEKGLEHLLVPLYGVWDDTKQIDFDALPEKFVIKCNHDYGSTIVVNKNSADYNRKDICEKLDKCLKRDFGYKGELHYRGIPRKIIAEKNLEMSDSEKALSSSIIDYKVWCFDGKPYSIQTISNRTKESILIETYDLNWNTHPEYLSPSNYFKIGNGKIPKPKSFTEMMDASSILSKGFPEVRVDFYEIDGRLYFGEMTFTSERGMIKSYTPEFCKILGDLVILPKRKR